MNAKHTAITTAIQGTSLPADDGDWHLKEFSVGQTFAPFTPYGSYASDVAAAVRCKLYASSDATRGTVTDSAAASATKFCSIATLRKRRM